MLPFSSKDLFLNLSYNRWHSKIKAVQRVACIGSFMGPLGPLAGPITSAWAIHQLQPFPKHSALLSASLLCGSLLHKMVETENITPLKRRLVVSMEDRFIMKNKKYPCGEVALCKPLTHSPTDPIVHGTSQDLPQLQFF